MRRWHALPVQLAATMAAALATSPAAAGDTPTMGRYMPWAPGLYLHAQLLRDSRDRVFDADGKRVGTAAPATGGDTRLPLTLVETRFEWHFPLFEAAGLPWLSTRTHMASATLRYGSTATRGALARFIDDSEQRLENAGDGFGDIRVEFGSFLVGGVDWRQRHGVPFALLLKLGAEIPTGVYDRNAPNNIGSNRWAVDVELGAHARPWSSAMLDAGIGWRSFGTNQEAKFGGLAPARDGDLLFFSASLSQRLLPGLHVALLADGDRGKANRYRDPRFTTTPPEPPPLAEALPAPGELRDGGTRVLRAGASLYAFLGQRALAGLHWRRPLSGRSGEMDVPHINRTPAGCIPGAVICTDSPGETVRADGLGPARRYASDRFTLSLSYNFGLGDPFPCPGCAQ